MDVRTLLLVVGLAFLPAAALAQEAEPAAPDDSPKLTIKELVATAFEKSKAATTGEDYTQVIDLCNQGLKSSPNAATRSYLQTLSAWAYNRRGKDFSTQAGEVSDEAEIARLEKLALADFEESVRRDPKKWQAIHNRGVSYALFGQFDKALNDFDRTLELNPKYANAWFNRGEIRYQRGQYDEAVRDYTQAIKLSPQDAMNYTARAHAQYQLEQYATAMADYNQAVKLAPENPLVYADRGDVYVNLGRWEDAARDYRQAVTLDENCGRAHVGAAWVMATCPDERYRDDVAALASAEKAIELGQTDWRSYDTLAAAQASSGDFDGAAENIAKAIEAAPKDQTQRLNARAALYAKKEPYREATRTASGAAASPR
jgi:tetratricopeptide (TPR) repeat protein